MDRIQESESPKMSSSKEKLLSMAEPNLFETKSCSKSEFVGDTENDTHDDSVKHIKVAVSESCTPMSECSPSEFQLKFPFDDNPHKYGSVEMDLPINNEGIGIAESSDFDLELVQLNKDFCGTSESAIELNPEINVEYSAQEKYDSQDSPHEKIVESTEETTSLIEHLSTLFPPHEASISETDSLLVGTDNIRTNSEFYGNNINMASAIYSENAVTKEDNLYYQGYTIRTEGADLCIHSVIFNEGSKFRIIIKTTDYDQYYRGTISRIESEPRILIDEEKWTMLYGSYDDDCLGVVEIEVPPGVSIANITYFGPQQGFITIDVPHNTQSEPQGQDSTLALNNVSSDE